MQSYRLSFVLPKLFSSVLVPLNLEPIRCFFRLCSKPFLAYGFHAAACAGYADVYWSQVFCASMLLVVCLRLTLLYDASQYAILNTRGFHLTLDVQIEEYSVQHLYLNLLGDGVAYLFCWCTAVSWGVFNFLPTLVDLTASICFCLLALHDLFLVSFLVHVVVCFLFHSMQIMLYPHQRFAASTPRWCRSLTLQR